MSTTSIPCIDNTAYIDAATAQADAIVSEATKWAIVYAAAALWKRYAAGAIADIRQGLAKRRLTMAQELLDHVRGSWAEEASFVSQTMAQPVPTTSYAFTSAVLNHVDGSEAYFTDSLDQQLACAGFSSDACFDNRTKRMLALARTDLVAHTMRSDEARTIALKDRRTDQQKVVLGMSHGVFAEAQSFGQLAGGKMQVREALMGTVNSALGLWGYESKRWRQGGLYGESMQEQPLVVPNGSALYRFDTPYGSGQTVAVLPTVIGSRYTSGEAQ